MILIFVPENGPSSPPRGTSELRPEALPQGPREEPSCGTDETTTLTAPKNVTWNVSFIAGNHHFERPPTVTPEHRQHQAILTNWTDTYDDVTPVWIQGAPTPETEEFCRRMCVPLVRDPKDICRTLDNSVVSDLHRCIQHGLWRRFLSLMSFVRNPKKLVNSVNDDNWIPLLSACYYPWNLDFIGVLLHHGADPAATNVHGTTCLHVAAYRNNAAHVNNLLTQLDPSVATALVQSKDEWGKTPLDHAKFFKFDDVVQLLERFKFFSPSS